jgi:protein-tyrosine phosphatase
MFDLHSHIIQGIDDGAKDMEMSLAMLQMAAENGTKGIVATPHVIEGEWLPEWDRIVMECDILQKTAQESGINISIFPGGEIAIHLDILDIVTGAGAYCINSGRYMLVELPANQIPSFTDNFFFSLQARGITPILAHPERHPALAKEPEILTEWIRRGILAQMNGTSITGEMGERVMATAEILLTNNMIHAIGSDAHRMHNRNTNLTLAAEKITAMIGVERANRLLVINPDSILHSREVEIPKIGKIIYPSKRNKVIEVLSQMWK